MIGKLKISDEAFSYLIHQRGALWNIRRDREGWELAYFRALAHTYHQMAPFLPEIDAPSILDIGSGMGGIDLMLWSHYSKTARFEFIDGVNQAPECVRHDRPYGDIGAAHRFLQDNGVKPSAFTDLGFSRDLIISTQAWCFHFAPETHLDFAYAIAKAGATFIIDVRTGRPAWKAALYDKLEFVDKAASLPKSDLLVFRKPLG